MREMDRERDKGYKREMKRDRSSVMPGPSLVWGTVQSWGLNLGFAVTQHVPLTTDLSS